MSTERNQQPSLHETVAILRGQHDTKIREEVNRPRAPRTPHGDGAEMQSIAAKHRIVRIDGGKGMSPKSAVKLIEAVGPKLAKLPSYAKIKGWEP